MDRATTFKNLGKRLTFRERLTKADRRKGLTPTHARITRKGELEIGDEGKAETLRREEALRFARWVIEAYGEAV